MNMETITHSDDTTKTAEYSRITDDLVAAFKTVYDPEIPVDVYELGLIYKVDINEDGHVDITMTLTAPACPAAEIIPANIEEAALTVKGVTSSKAIITFDPPWTKDNMSDEAKLVLNMF
jgi:FeS assembly SUF system protein